MQLRIFNHQIHLNPLPVKADPLLLLEASSLPLPRDQAKTSPDTKASQADACLPQGLSPSPPLQLQSSCSMLYCGSTAQSWEVKRYFTKELQKQGKIMSPRTGRTYLEMDFEGAEQKSVRLDMEDFVDMWHSPVTHNLTSCRGQLRLVLIYCWNYSLKLGGVAGNDTLLQTG